jgi:small subunit ribosomal protein S2
MITLEKLLTSGVHLGHPIKQCNSKMLPFVYGYKNGIHIIDLVQTILSLFQVGNFIFNSSKKNKSCVN